MEGDTGHLRFNEDGDRQDAMYEIKNIDESGKTQAAGLYGGTIKVSQNKVRHPKLLSMRIVLWRMDLKVW